MAINPLSGNFQPDSSVSAGKSLPNTPTPRSSEAKAIEPTTTSTKPTRNVATAAAVANQSEAARVDTLNQQLAPISQNIQRGLKFQVDDVTGRPVISVIDRQTDETIRQIPPEELLTLSRRLKELSEELSTPSGVLLKTDA